MNRNRLFNVFVASALLLMIVLALHGANETSKVASAVSASGSVHSGLLCDTLIVDRSSIRRVYVEQMDSWLTFTDSGITGVDGGLIQLLSNTQVCTK